MNDYDSIIGSQQRPPPAPPAPPRDDSGEDSCRTCCDRCRQRDERHKENMRFFYQMARFAEHNVAVVATLCVLKALVYPAEVGHFLLQLAASR